MSNKPTFYINNVKESIIVFNEGINEAVTEDGSPIIVMKNGKLKADELVFFTVEKLNLTNANRIADGNELFAKRLIERSKIRDIFKFSIYELNGECEEFGFAEGLRNDNVDEYMQMASVAFGVIREKIRVFTD